MVVRELGATAATVEEPRRWPERPRDAGRVVPGAGGKVTSQNGLPARAAQRAAAGASTGAAGV